METKNIYPPLPVMYSVEKLSTSRFHESAYLFRVDDHGDDRGSFLFNDIVEEMWVFIRYPQGRLGQTAVNRRCHVSMQRFRRGESLWSTKPRAGLESTANF